ncbi:MAG: YiiD C-terminal domain-containing protein, partial [Gammaproteobacteria bacterium]|nr:YiiD C-terminal domain-containing protein [Gammaproteobacteria bacterium]
MTDSFLDWIHQQIPLTAAMQIDQLDYSGRSISLSAPLAPNINDKGTAFAGATAGLATLTGWCLITLWLREQGMAADVMIAGSQLDYHAPVTSRLQTNAELPDAVVMDSFLSRLREKGRARLDLRVL